MIMSKIRNILFVSHSAELNGAEISLLRLLQDLDRTRFKPFLVLPRDGLLSREAGRADVDVQTVPYSWWLTERRNRWKQPLAWLWNRPKIRALEKIIRMKNIHLVYSNSAAAGCGAEAVSYTHLRAHET